MNETLKTTLAAMIAAAAFALLAFASSELARDGARIAAVWLPNAVALAVLLRARHPREPLLLVAMWLGNAAAAHVVGDSPVKAITLASCNVIEIVIALILTKRACGPRIDMARIDHIGAIVVAAGLAAPAVSATLATLTLGLEDRLAPSIWADWFTAHALAMMLVAPIALVLLGAITRPRRVIAGTPGEWAVQMALSAAVTAAVFLQAELTLLFLTAPIVIVPALRLGAPGAAGSVAAMAAVAATCTLNGLGPIGLIEGPAGLKLSILQAFLIAALAMGLPVAAVQAGERRLVTRLDGQAAQLRLLTDTISDAVLRFDRNGYCTYASPSVAQVLGLPPSVFLGLRASDRAHPQARAAISEVETRLIGGISQRERITYRRFADDEDGEPVFIEADAVIARDPATQTVDGFVICARNATDRVGLERELARTRRTLAGTRDARAEFVAGMIRSIRARLEQLQVGALQLAHAELDPPQQLQADTIAASGARLLRQMGAIEELVAIEAGRRAVRHVPVGLRQLLEACVSAHRPQATRQGLMLTFSCAPEIPATLVTDGAHLRQILIALIGNAVRHTRSGSIAVRARIDDGDVVFAVEDSGPGIGSDRREAIFQPFADSQASGGHGSGALLGTGLSLAIARRLAEMLDGTLIAEGSADGGARFVLRLPRQTPGARLERRAEPGEESSAAEAARRRSWLERRTEAMIAVDLALRLGEFGGAEIDDLAALIRTVAGSAASFGEEELGRRAAALEHGLRAGGPAETNARLAQALLQAAA